MNKNDIAVLVTLVIVVVGFGFLFFAAPKAPEVAYAPVMLPGSALLAVPTESPENSQVFQANLVEGGFITLHQSLGGAPGPIIVASEYLEKGIYDAASIALSTPLIPGMDYVALLHVDNGDGAFVPQEDLPVRTDSGVVRADFRAGAAEDLETSQ